MRVAEDVEAGAVTLVAERRAIDKSLLGLCRVHVKLVGHVWAEVDPYGRENHLLPDLRVLNVRRVGNNPEVGRWSLLSQRYGRGTEYEANERRCHHESLHAAITLTVLR